MKFVTARDSLRPSQYLIHGLDRFKLGEEGLLVPMDNCSTFTLAMLTSEEWEVREQPRAVFTTLYIPLEKLDMLCNMYVAPVPNTVTVNLNYVVQP